MTVRPSPRVQELDTLNSRDSVYEGLAFRQIDFHLLREGSLHACHRKQQGSNKEKYSLFHNCEKFLSLVIEASEVVK